MFSLLIILALVMLLIIILTKKDIPLGFNLFLGAVIIAIFTGGYKILPQYIILTLKDTTTLELLVAVSLIQILGYTLKITNRMQRVINSLYDVLEDLRLVLMFIPVLIALIPGPGVVMLSAPLIEESTKNLLSPEKKSFINFWFRAAVQFCSPTSFAFIIAINMTNASSQHLFFIQLFFALGMLLMGYLLELKKLPRIVNDEFDSKKQRKSSGANSIIHLLKNCSFLILILILTVGFGIRVSLAVITAFILVIFEEKILLSQLADIFKKGFSWKMFMLILGMMFFSTTIQESAIIDDISSWWVGLGMPVELLLILLPLLIGLVIGNYAGAAAITFALLAPMIQSYNLGIIPIAVIYSLSRIGCIFSPTNSSVILTVEYFRANLMKVYVKFAYMMPPVLIMISALYLFELLGRY